MVSSPQLTSQRCADNTDDNCVDQTESVVNNNSRPILPPLISSKLYISTIITLFISIGISYIYRTVCPYLLSNSYNSNNYGTTSTHMIPHPDYDHLPGLSTITDYSYAIVFDGGSTGTRVHIFSFSTQTERRSRRIYLESEIFQSITPGLSSYAENTSRAAISIDPLLQRALATVPTDKAVHTSVILKATAGLRLLPRQSADDILRSVKAKLESSPYKVHKDSVSVLDGQAEGLYAWYTVNFLLGKLHDIRNSIVTLDLGGGSTQITFATNNTETLVRSPNGYIIKENIEGEPEYLYTNSYLGYGLMSTRKQILMSSVDDNNGSHPYQTDDHHRVVRVRTPCFASNSNITENWTFESITYEVSGYQSSTDSFEQCYRLCRQWVANRIHKPDELADRQVFGLSYYYDRMKDVRLVKDTVGVVKVRDYYLIAENVCKSIVKFKKQSPFLCLDLVYITAYLREGLGLDWQKDITLVKKINGIETSWALGAAINLINIAKQNTTTPSTSTSTSTGQQ